MCRYDEDYDWYVESEHQAVELAVTLKCEDCGRDIPPLEPYRLFLAILAMETDEDWSPLVFVAQWPTPGQRYVDSARPYLIVDEDVADTYEALGFCVEEVNESELHPKPPQERVSCMHCRVANVWLERVCDQHTVLVTRMDLEQHWDEYDDATLGPDFGTLNTLAQQQWRSKLTGRLIPTHVIKRLANNAADFAIAGGMLHD